MRVWVIYLWERLRTSLWVIPATMTLCAAVLAYFTADFDRLLNHWDWARQLLYQGTPVGTRSLLSTVAGSMITVAGVSFSVTMVALSLTSSQLGPRLLSNFMRDKGNQLVLGSFIATFMYCLLALGVVSEQSASMNSISASAALLFSIISLMLLIYFIHHIANSMQADVIVQSIAKDLDKSLCSLFTSTDKHTPMADVQVRDGLKDSVFAEITCVGSGYLQGIDESSLIRISRKHNFCVEMLRRPGHYLTPGLPLFRVIGQDSVSPAITSRLLRLFIVGGSRTPEQDPEYAIFQLVEVALRALSPGINDPFTAMTCIDHLSGSLASVASAPAKPPFRSDEDDVCRLLLDEINFAAIVDAAFDQIRQTAQGNAATSIRMLEAFTRIVTVAEGPGRAAALKKQADQLYESNLERLSAKDLQALGDRYDVFLQIAGKKMH